MTSESEFRSPSCLDTSGYVRQRIAPHPGDVLYLHLSDLKLALDQYGPFRDERVLDYGCGGSPYRSLFSGRTYHRADIPGVADLDFEFGPDSRISAPAAAYDCVLSTQVLEHVRDVQTYLTEAARLLVPGGRLILTTHGVFPDHGCPYDFRRWTADGLRADLESAGLRVSRVSKLTTGPRALAMLNQEFHTRMKPRERSLVAAGWRFSWLLYGKTRRRLNLFLDREYRDCRVVPADTPGHEFYVALIAEARRPA